MPTLQEKLRQRQADEQVDGYSIFYASGPSRTPNSYVQATKDPDDYELMQSETTAAAAALFDRYDE